MIGIIARFNTIEELSLPENPVHWVRTIAGDIMPAPENVQRGEIMTANITVSAVTENDLDSVRLLLQELLNVMDDTEVFSIEQSEKNFQRMLVEHDNYMLAARKDDDIIGFINFSVRKTLMHPEPSGLIDELVVSESSRGLGVGKLLINAVIEQCRELGCCELEVSTEKSNKNARQFYKSCGFEEGVLFELDL